MNLTLTNAEWSALLEALSRADDEWEAEQDDGVARRRRQRAALGRAREKLVSRRHSGLV